jgi:predicted acyl esterase
VATGDDRGGAMAAHDRERRQAEMNTRGWARRLVAAGAVGASAWLVVSTLVATGASGSAATFHAVGSAEQVDVTGLPPSGPATLLDAAGNTVATEDADAQGGLLFRDVTPGTYQVRSDTDGTESDPLVVHDLSAAPWDPSIYSQKLPTNGYGYLTTRDGTKLAVDVHPPTSPAGEPGVPAGTTLPNLPVHAPFTPPYPTLIEYSGYGYADPAGPVNGIAVVANLMGFAVVDVNMRGTGCSGGAFDFFEPLQNLDAYDVIETVAHQSWVGGIYDPATGGHKVGMMGISYGGISQLFAAQLQPPDLAAISPLSVIDATATTLYPGGDLNTGFAVAWAQQRQQEATPVVKQPNGSYSGGQSWADQQVASGDKTCAADQALHGEAADLMAKIRANSHYVASVADPLDPVTFVHNIDVPTFLACQFEDEQTGGHCPELVQHFTGTDQKWFTFTNGAHIDSLDPGTLNRWYDFLELFVAHQAPIVNAPLVHAAAPVVYQAAMGQSQTDVVNLPVDPIQALPTYKLALAAWEKQPEVTVNFDNGAGTGPTGTNAAGDPYPGFSAGFSSLPVPGTSARTWYLGPDGSLTDNPPGASGIDRYTADPTALPANDFGANTGTGGLWGNASQWSWNWKQNPAGTAVSYVTAPLTADTAVVGAGAVYVWVRSATPDVDLQATVSEVRPDGKETFVQNGWMRASERALSTTADNIFKTPSTLLDPIPSELAADVAPMPAGQFALVAIPLYYEGHMYRAGSRIRVTISSVNGTQPIWSFAEPQPATGTDAVDIAHSTLMPSSLVLPVIGGLSAPTTLPKCPSLRNEPCRPYKASPNQTVAS